MKREKLQQTMSSEGPQTLGEATKRLTCHDLLVSLVTAYPRLRSTHKNGFKSSLFLPYMCPYMCTEGVKESTN
jgi:hypothetical protein